MAASDGYINTYIDDCEGVVSGRKIATAAPKELRSHLLINRISRINVCSQPAKAASPFLSPRSLWMRLRHSHARRSTWIFRESCRENLARLVYWIIWSRVGFQLLYCITGYELCTCRCSIHLYAYTLIHCDLKYHTCTVGFGGQLR